MVDNSQSVCYNNDDRIAGGYWQCSPIRVHCGGCEVFSKNHDTGPSR